MILVLLTIAASTGPSFAGGPGPEASIVFATVPTDEPPVTANEFLPEDRDVTSCIGTLERPGCGSESRGGWRQTLILVAMFLGLVVVFGNVVRGVRRNRS